MRVNTEFYSMDTSFGLVNPRLTYSSLQVVFCVKPGTFFKCSLQLGWRLTGVRSTHTECSLNVPRMFPGMVGIGGQPQQAHPPAGAGGGGAAANHERSSAPEPEHGNPPQHHSQVHNFVPRAGEGP